MKKIIVILFVFPQLLWAKDLELPDYLKRYLSQQEDLKNNELDVEKSSNFLSNTQSLYKTSLNITPKYTGQDFQKTEYGDYKVNNSEIEGQLIQTFPYATKLTLSGNFENNKYTHTELEQKTSTYSLTLEQPLYKNRWGKMWTQAQEMANYDLLSVIENRKTLTFEECSSAMLNYSKAYLSQEKSRIFTEVEESARKVFEFTEFNYKKRIIDKLNFLTSKADWISIKEQSFLLQRDHQQNILEISKYVPVEETVKFTPPFSFVTVLTSKSPDMQNNSTYRSMKSSQIGLNIKHEYTKESVKPDINLFVSGARSNTLQQVNNVIGTDSQNSSIVAGVSLDLPLFDKNREVTVANALIEKEISRNNLQKFARNFDEITATLQSKIKAKEQQIAVLQEKKEIFKQRSEEALKYLKRGRIDFKNYVVYRDSYNNVRIEALILQRDLLELKLAYLALDNSLPQICMVK